MRFLGICCMFLLSITTLYSQHCHTKEIGVKGKVKKITCIYYVEGVSANNSWSPKDSAKFTYKTISFFNASQNLDSVQTFVNHAGKEKMVTRKGYTYAKNDISGWEYDHTD